MKKLLLTTSILAAISSPSYAEIDINGFANLIAGKTTTDNAYAGYDNDISFSEQSNFALQFSTDINDKLRATAQLLSRGENDYDLEMEWAYVTYQATNNLDVSAGRLRLPLFMYSASLDVGYSYHWLTPPDAVYDVVFDRIDGIQFNYTDYTDYFDYNIQITMGENDTDFQTNGRDSNVKTNNSVAITGEVVKDNFTVRAVAARTTATFVIDGIDAAISSLSTISPALSDTLAADEDTGRFLGLGFNYDNAKWFVVGEYTVVELEDTFYPKEKNAYISAGYREGKWTPFISIERRDLNNGIKFLEQVSQLPDAAQAQAAMIVTGVQEPSIEDSRSYTVGLRYDLDTGIALKADVTRHEDSLGDNNDATLVRAAVSYVF